jgi:hypothetical protein
MRRNLIARHGMDEVLGGATVSTGVLVTRYVREGEVGTGSFG